MNPLTLVKRIQSINSKEADLGISDEASWHAKYRDSAYIFVGGIPYDLTEGDLLAVFAQYGEVVDVNLVRDKATGKSKGFAFLAYEDQRSTTLAVDNLNGAQVLGRIIRVDHCSKYVKREEEDEETQLQKREARGVCRAFQRGECTRGASCKFSHDEQRAANTGWGHDEDKGSRWDHDKFEGVKKAEKRHINRKDFQSDDKERNYKANRDTHGYPEKSGGREVKRIGRGDEVDETELKSRGEFEGRQDKRVKSHYRDDGDTREEKRVTRRYELESEQRSIDDRDRRDDKRSTRSVDESEQKPRDDALRRKEKRSRRNDDDDNYRTEEKQSRKHGSDEYEPRSSRHCDSRDDKESGRQSKTSLRRDPDEGAGNKPLRHDRERENRNRERDR